MPGIPYIPEQITVHMGSPDSDAENITVDFPYYIKNVASSEIYPTWPESSLRANIYVIITYALNRIYTEWYRARGYDFDITSTTQFDQAFVQNRDIFENISQIVDEIFNDYVRKQGSIEPYFTSFCNGTTVTCSGLSQWGTVELANRGYTPYEILKNYYGNDIEIVRNAEVRTNTPSYPEIILNLGMSGNDVRTIQVQLNRISRNYPAIPKIESPDGTFGVQTEEAVKAFQSIFNLNVTGMVDKATWYKIAYIYISVKRLAELNSEGLSIEEVSKQYSEELRIGMDGSEISNLQYYLAVVGAYYQSVQPVDITGYFGEQTEASVKSFQRVFGLPETGVVDRRTWNDLYRAYLGIIESIPLGEGDDVVLYPGIVLKEGMTNEYIRILQNYLSYIHETYPTIPAVNTTGYFGPLTKNSVMAFQRQFGLNPNGLVNANTWNEIANQYSVLKYGYEKQPYQYPGYVITG
ncbi:MAG TPA: spore cortex-lytic protein [Ruminococcus sp.]|nr:spore cortex-lytic protein [Ruminococcus sp.]HCR74420.1 spore cortex-lytic protein [Ruminococcus sp.]